MSLKPVWAVEDITTIIPSQESIVQTDCCEDVLLKPNGIEGLSVDIDSKITNSWVKVMIPTDQISKIPTFKSLAVILLPRPPARLSSIHAVSAIFTYG